MRERASDMGQEKDASEEMERHIVEDLRQRLGLSTSCSGVLFHTAGMVWLASLALARDRVAPLLKKAGRIGPVGPGHLRLRVYASLHASLQIEQAAILLGLGTEGVCRIPPDDAGVLAAEAVEQAIEQDRTSGWVPMAVVATRGTPTTNALDPLGELADLCAREHLWLHVDATATGPFALLPEMRWLLAGCDQAHAVGLDWTGVGLQGSTLFLSSATSLRHAMERFRLLSGTTAERAPLLHLLAGAFRCEDGKLEAHMRHQRKWAQSFSDWIDESRLFERMATTLFARVAFRAAPSDTDIELNVLNHTLFEHLQKHMIQYPSIDLSVCIFTEHVGMRIVSTACEDAHHEPVTFGTWIEHELLHLLSSWPQGDEKSSEFPHPKE